jgi:uncharacterized protein involved in high-affinity Fe2+ transport
MKLIYDCRRDALTRCRKPNGRCDGVSPPRAPTAPGMRGMMPTPTGLITFQESPRMNKVLSALLLSASLSATAFAAEYPIGKPVEHAGLEVAAVYLQPIEMAPAGVMRPAKDSDIHLEADIHALARNPNGFPEGAWMPYLVIHYTLQKQGGKTLSGEMMPMVADDGPHYGDNVKLEGPGKYKLTLNIAPPTANKMNHFGRHIDKETGVAPWFQAFETQYEFVYAGTGKKGGY